MEGGELYAEGRVRARVGGAKYVGEGGGGGGSEGCFISMSWLEGAFGLNLYEIG